MERKIPCTMSTQHPDNASLPRWCTGNTIQGDDEVYEAYFAYKELGCQEVMWDSEGKDVDTRVVRKLLSNYPDYFKENVIGRDVFLTYRIPNPRIEVAEKKIVVETLWNVSVASDVASAFYGSERVPIFEMILPFTTDAKELIQLFNYYKKAIAATDNIRLNRHTKPKDWVGPLKPKSIEVIPLVEEMSDFLSIDNIVGGYLKAVKPRYLRAFLARSDPALNYGLFCAVLLCKLALSKLRLLGEKQGVAVYPILGAGAVPFRGHLSPDNIQRFLKEYPGIYTVTIQSALKYDYPLKRVRKTVEILNKELPNGEAVLIDPAEEKILLSAMTKLKSRYQDTIEKLAPLINSVASYVPPRRARKLHIGLFGYSRGFRDVILPRAIPFAAVFYSLGVPPEFIGARALSELNEDEWETLEKFYVNIKEDLKAAAGYLSWRNMEMWSDMCRQLAKRAGLSEKDLKSGREQILADLDLIEKNLGIKVGPRNLSHKKHENFTNNFLMSYLEQNVEVAKSQLLEAAKLRRYLG